MWVVPCAPGGVVDSNLFEQVDDAGFSPRGVKIGVYFQHFGNGSADGFDRVEGVVGVLGYQAYVAAADAPPLGVIESCELERWALLAAEQHCPADHFSIVRQQAECGVRAGGFT